MAHNKKRSVFLEKRKNRTNPVFNKWTDWSALQDCDEEQLKVLQLGFNGYKPDELPHKAFAAIKRLCPDAQTALDYGAGMGRNYPTVAQMAKWVDYIDLAALKGKKLVEWANYRELHYVDQYVPKLVHHYDIIYTSLVLKHTQDQDVLDAILKQLATHCKLLVTCGEVRLQMNNRFFESIETFTVHQKHFEHPLPLTLWKPRKLRRFA